MLMFSCCDIGGSSMGGGSMSCRVLLRVSGWDVVCPGCWLVVLEGMLR